MFETKAEYTFTIFDIDVTYAYRPNDDIYTDIVPKQFEITVQMPIGLFKRLTFDMQKDFLKSKVMEELGERIEFDTPDSPDFEISDVDFNFETVD